MRQSITDTYSIREEVLGAWLHHLSLVRNICAQHGRLWNRKFTVISKMPLNKPHGLPTQFCHDSRRVYNSLVCMSHLLKEIDRKSEWNKKNIELIDNYAIDTSKMDFPDNWREKEIWLV